ncbi:MAG: AAA family ATPase [Bacteroidota bacterium]
MILSFQKIRSVGRYTNFLTANVPTTQKVATFQHFNFIYGENGTGKTTLTHLLRSLKGDNTFLLKKRTFAVRNSPEITINAEQETLLYDNYEWTTHLPNLEIFDIHFINNNIYTGLEIQNDHKKRLFEIILGDQGVQLKNDIQTIKTRIRNGNKIVRETSRTLEALIGNAFTAIDYANLSTYPDIKAKIALKEKELDTAKNYQIIQEKPALSPLPAIQLPLDLVHLRTTLQQSIDFISADYLEQFKAHKAKLQFDQAEEWLQQGMAHKYDDQCPFCRQKIDDSVGMLSAYQQYFNATYKQLIADSHQLNTAIINYNLVAKILEIEKLLTTNWNLIDFWKTYLSKAPTLLSIAEEKNELLAAFELLKQTVQEKVNHPTNEINLDNLNQFEKLLTDLTDKLAGMNALIQNYNDSIEAMKAHQDTDVHRIEIELNQLEAIAQRGHPEVVEHCDNLLKYSSAIVQLKARNEAKKKQLDQFKGIVFGSYLSIINRHLQHFAPYLSLQKLTSGYLGSSTEPVVKFALCINGKEVTHKEKVDRIAMKYALSEGDKNALALAFFLAKLEFSENLAEKIIVFDDPVSSFDRNRQSKLLDQLIHFGQQSQQLFFLTHDLRLGQEFVRRVTKADLPITKCQLTFFNETMNIVKQK